MFYVTTAIDYTNAPPHIGHAYEKILADTLARYHRLAGEPTFFLTGVDQHGQKVQQAAQKLGLPPARFAAETTAHFVALWKTLEISYDGWAETTSPVHRACVSAILQDLHDRGELYKASHRGFYSVRQEQFLTDKERLPDGTFGEEWGEVVELAEENWYFRLAKHRDWLLAHIRSNPGYVTPAFRQTELLNAVERLQGDLCISRPKARLAWGIEIPFDPDYVTYVWFDALINYISFAGYLPGGRAAPEFAARWPALHVIGKDILAPAHGIYWPIMLHAIGFDGPDIPPLLVHGYINSAGAKISKSLGNTVDPRELAERYGPEALRYYLMRDAATGQDMDFSEERLVARANADLSNGLGNLLNRTLNMAKRYRDGVLSAGGETELSDAAARLLPIYRERMEAYQVHAALEAVWDLVNRANAFVESSAPWKLAKDPAAAGRLSTVLYHLAESLRIAAILVSPVLPAAAARIFEQLRWGAGRSLADAAWGGLADGHRLGEPTPLFPRIP